MSTKDVNDTPGTTKFRRQVTDAADVHEGAAAAGIFSASAPLGIARSQSQDLD